MLYISEFARRAYLAVATRKAKPRALNKDKRRYLVETAVSILESGQPTKFAFEAATRHGLRRAFCLDGWSWHEADLAAETIVAAALRSIGAQRPTWREAQPEYAQDGYAPVEYTRCLNCGGEIPSDRGSSNRRTVMYCSGLCGQAAYRRKARHFGDTVSKAEYLAAMAARTKRTYQEPKECERCGEVFKPGYAINRRRFCSVGCANVGKAIPNRNSFARLHGPRTCIGCGTAFQPRRGTLKYCSIACYEDRGRSPQRGEERSCAVCQASFRVHSRKLPQQTCSRACAWKLRKSGALRCEEVAPDLAPDG